MIVDTIELYSKCSQCIVKCRCSQDAVEVLPDYMKDFYLFLLKTFDSCEEELGPKKRYRVFYLKEMASID